MAEKEGDLIFGMKLSVDPAQFTNGWDKIEPELQKIIDAKPLKVRVEVDNAALKDAVAQLSKLQTGGVKPSTTAAMVVAGAKADVIKAKAVQQNVIETNKLRISNANAEKSELALERAKQRGIASVHTQNKAYQAQRGILNGMPQFVNSYISILGAYRLGKNIVDTTAEFEMQRVSLAAIIQNKTEADRLFAQSVEMGIESPFMIKDIITYTKQLAAYRIETDQLFDTTKRLADVSAGLGVGMDRLILAYGQVKAASVLRGQELRQFTEAGIPMVELLADKFTILNGKATTTAEVFDMIRARGVSFEMVKEIFEDMTNAGGMFNNMQAIQAQTLKGSLTNLRDAMDKTFMQMGEGAKGPIKNLVDGLRMLMENWKEVSDVGLGVVGVLATAKIATMAYNAALGAETVTVIANVMSEKKKEAITLQRLAATRALSAAERLQIATTRKLTMADWESMAAKGQLTKLMLFQAVATKRITVMQGEILGMMIGVKRAEIAQITTKSKLIVYTKLLTAALKVQLVALRATMTALLTNPLTWIAAAAFGVYKLVSGIVKYNKEYTEMADNMRKQSAQVAGEMTDSYKGMATSIQEAFGKGASEQAMMSARKSMQDILEKNELIKVLLDARLSKLLTEKERLEEVRDMWNEVHAAAKNDPGYMASAQKGTGGLLDDDVVENAEKVADKLNEINSYLAKTDAKGYNVIGVRKEFDELRRQFDEGEISIDNFSSELQSMLRSNKESLDGTVFGKLSGKIKDSRIALRGFESDMERMAKSTIAQIGAIDGELPVFGVDKFGLSDESLGNLQSRLATQTNFWLQSLGDIDNGAKRLLTTQMKIQAQFPFKNEDPEENPYAKSYNAFLEKRGLGKVAKMGKYDMEKSDATQLESVASALKTAEEELERYNAQVKAGNNLNKIKISGKKEEIRQLKIAWAFLGGTEKSIGSKAKTTDSRIATAVNQLKVLREALSKYNKLRETIGNAAARTEIQSLYGGLTGGLSLAFSGSEMEAASKLIEAKLGKMGDEGTKAMKDAIMQRTDTSFDEIAANFKRNLDQMGRKIEQTQRANEFFEKMLGLTGSEEAAARLTKAMGMAVGDMRSGYYAALGDILGHDYMQGVDLGDVKSTQDAINKMRVDGYTTAADAAQAQLDGLVDYEQKQLETILATTEEFMTAEQKKAQIARTTAKLLKDIENNPTLTTEQKSAYSAAATKLGTTKSAGVDLEVLQGTELYIKAFEDLDAVSNLTLTKIVGELQKLADSGSLSATDLKTVVDQIDKAKKTMELNSPFATLTISVKEYKAALIELHRVQADTSSTTEQLAAAQDKVKASLSKTKRSMETLQSNFEEVAGSIRDVIDLSRKVAEQFGITFSDETEEYISAFTTGIEIATGAISVMTTVVALLDAALAPLLIVALAIGAAFVGFKILDNLINKGTADKIKANADMIEVLNERLKQLADAEDDVIGKMYVKNINDQIKATEELIALEKSNIEANKNGKHFLWWSWSDDEAIKESKDKISEYYNDIEGLHEDFMQEMTGYSGSIDAAYAFADSWYDAYLSSADTFDAISEKFDEMIDSMIVKSLLAAATEAKLAPIFTMIQDAYKDGIMTPEELAAIQNASAAVTVTLDPELRGIMAGVYAGGVKPATDKTSLSGIAASVATMDESAANTLGGYLNSGLMQWVKQTGLQNRIALAVEANNVQKPLADIYALQSQSLAAIQSIKADTAVMVSRLTRLVENNDATMISGGQKAINVRLLN